MKKLIILMLLVSFGFAQQRTVKQLYSRNITLTTFWQKVGLPSVGLTWDLYICPVGTDTVKMVFSQADTTATVASLVKEWKSVLLTTNPQTPVGSCRVDTLYLKGSAATTVLIRGVAR